MPMKEKFTHDHLMKHLYEETGVTENQAINEALEHNYHLREELEQYEDVKAMLDKVNYKPRRSVVRDILTYSRKNNNTMELLC